MMSPVQLVRWIACSADRWRLDRYVQLFLVMAERHSDVSDQVNELRTFFIIIEHYSLLVWYGDFCFSFIHRYVTCHLLDIRVVS